MTKGDNLLAGMAKVLKELDKLLKDRPAPKVLGAAIDALDELRDSRKALQAKAERAKELESKFEEAIFSKFTKAELEGGRGKRAQASVTRREHATIEDYDRLSAYILEKGELDLLQRRLSAEAVKARWSEGVVVPGVGKYVDVRLSLTKFKSKK